MKKAIVLVVDDDSEARSMVCGFLGERFDCDFKEAGDGEEAVEFVKSNPCDVIFLDVKLPKKSGTIVMKEVKEINPNIDIIVVSAHSSDEIADESFKRGASEYIVKPIDMTTLPQKFAAILKKRGHRIGKT